MGSRPGQCGRSGAAELVTSSHHTLSTPPFLTLHADHGPCEWSGVYRTTAGRAATIRAGCCIDTKLSLEGSDRCIRLLYRQIDKHVQTQRAEKQQYNTWVGEKISRPLLGLCCVLSAAAGASVSEATR